MLKLANVTLLTMTNVVFVTLRLFSLKISFSFLELVTNVRNVTKNQVNFATSVVFVTNFQKQKEIYKLNNLNVTNTTFVIVSNVTFANFSM